MSFLRVLHLLAFVLALAAWTWGLLSPSPVPEIVTRKLTVDWQFYFSKCLHAGMYAGLMVFGGLLAPPGRWRGLLVGLLAVHSIATEAGQAMMDLGRHGSVRDVLIDWAGIVVGFAVLKWFPVRKADDYTRLTLPGP